ncbi:hypothetical protein BKA63DRAFT_526825 [Paraphoma chrysanthemicola]|nr:hypothetical protein BKA63DRAFT_526825 [Paraphoma chrysanthemicola]
MVGGHTPGSSRRCDNCTRRRKKCDLQAPRCGPCQQSRLLCSGPKSEDATFINNAAQTFRSGEQRQALRVAYRNRTGVGGADNGASFENFYQLVLRNVQLLRSAVARNEFKSSMHNRLAERMAGDYSTQSTYAALLEDFKPRMSGGIFGADRVDLPSLKHYSNIANCLRGLVPLAFTASPLLDHSIFSLLSLYYGQLHGDEGLQRLSQSTYTHALQHFHKQLAIVLSQQVGAHTKAHGELFCSSIALQVLEHLRSIEVHGFAHLAHIDGGLSMLKDFGLEMVKQSASIRTAWRGFRGIAACVAIERRAPTFLADSIWLQAPWEGSSKVARDELNDLGLLIPAQLHLGDVLSAAAQRGDLTPTSTIDGSLLQLNAISNLQRRLTQWLYRLETGIECALYWPNLNVPSRARSQRDPECQQKYTSDFQRLTFSCGTIAGLLAYFWSLELELLMSRIDLHELILRYSDSDDPLLPHARTVTDNSLKHDVERAEEVSQLILQTEPRLNSCYEGLICIQSSMRTLHRYSKHSRSRL